MSRLSLRTSLVVLLVGAPLQHHHVSSTTANNKLSLSTLRSLLDCTELEMHLAPPSCAPALQWRALLRHVLNFSKHYGAEPKQNVLTYWSQCCAGALPTEGNIPLPANASLLFSQTATALTVVPDSANASSLSLQLRGLSPITTYALPLRRADRLPTASYFRLLPSWAPSAVLLFHPVRASARQLHI